MLKHHDAVILCRDSREYPGHSLCLQHIMFNDIVQKFLSIPIEFSGFFSLYRMIEYIRKFTLHLPGIEKEGPVDIFTKLFQGMIIKHGNPRMCRFRRCIACVIGKKPVPPGLFQ